MCPYQHKGVCLKASDVLGTICLATNHLCEISCKSYWHGPYNGRTISEEQMTVFAAKMLKCNAELSIEKISQRYSVPLDIQIPENIDEIKQKLLPLYNISWIKGIRLSGSILFKNITHKDLDVVLVVSDLKSYLDNKIEIPQQIAGLEVDVFACTDTSFFLTLDLQTYALHKSAVYNIRSVDPKISSVIDTGKEVYLSF